MAVKKRKSKLRKPIQKRKARLRARKRTPGAARPAVRLPRTAKLPGTSTPASARAFVSGVELPRAKARRRDGPAEALTLQEMGFDAAKDQAALVGSEIVSFVSGVTAERREAITNAALLAQLAATKAVPDETNIDAWYRKYFETLKKVGWVLQDYEFKEYEEASQGFEAHQAILEVAALFMGAAAPAAMLVLTTTLKALQSMGKDNPWITLFDRQSRVSTVARFQVSIAEQEPGGQFIVRTMAFVLSAKSTITQVLFFKATENQAKLRYHSGKVTVDAAVLEGVSAAIKAKLVAHARDFIHTLDL